MSEIKLSPCPFCGGKAKFATVNHKWIECTMCEMETPYRESKEELVALWNTRKPIEDMVEQLDKACFSPEGDYPGFVIDAEQAVDIVRGGRE